MQISGESARNESALFAKSSILPLALKELNKVENKSKEKLLILRCGPDKVQSYQTVLILIFHL